MVTSVSNYPAQLSSAARHDHPAAGPGEAGTAGEGDSGAEAPLCEQIDLPFLFRIPMKRRT